MCVGIQQYWFWFIPFLYMCVGIQQYKYWFIPFLYMCVGIQQYWFWFIPFFIYVCGYTTILVLVYSIFIYVCGYTTVAHLAFVTGSGLYHFLYMCVGIQQYWFWFIPFLYMCVGIQQLLIWLLLLVLVYTIFHYPILHCIYIFSSECNVFFYYVALYIILVLDQANGHEVVNWFSFLFAQFPNLAEPVFYNICPIVSCW